MKSPIAIFLCFVVTVFGCDGQKVREEPVPTQIVAMCAMAGDLTSAVLKTGDVNDARRLLLYGKPWILVCTGEPVRWIPAAMSDQEVWQAVRELQGQMSRW